MDGEAPEQSACPHSLAAFPAPAWSDATGLCRRRLEEGGKAIVQHEPYCRVCGYPLGEYETEQRMTMGYNAAQPQPFLAHQDCDDVPEVRAKYLSLARTMIQRGIHAPGFDAEAYIGRYGPQACKTPGQEA